ncbi:MAG: hypothetical protein ACOC57_04715 [Acidobacteriota bacterium]
MKRYITVLSLFFLIISFLHGYIQSDQDNRLFQEAKLLIFDKEWSRAQLKLEKLLEEYPESRWYSEAVFYRAKCLQEQKGKEEEALKAFLDYLSLPNRSRTLSEEAEIGILDLAFSLMEKGKSKFQNEILKRLDSKGKIIRYYAAFKLSYAKNKQTAKKGLPVLKEILNKEKDDELRDRAKIAILRVDPEALRDLSAAKPERRARILNIEVYQNGEVKFRLSIPWSLADLALGAIDEKDKALLKEKGYDVNRIIRELTEYEGSILEIKSEDSLIKMWID